MPYRMTVLLQQMTGGLIALAVALIAATAAGLALRRRAGRFRTVPIPGVSTAARARDDSAPPRGDLAPARGDLALTAADLGAELGERATLVQFSTAFCAPCRPTRQLLAQVAGMVPGVRHVDIDATTRLDLVRRLRIASTPTVLVLGPGGVIAKRATGLPRKADVIAALGQALELGGLGTGNVTGPGSDSRSESE
jgi:thiol-disulfide isomerase/thioredoxin